MAYSTLIDRGPGSGFRPATSSTSLFNPTYGRRACRNRPISSAYIAGAASNHHLWPSANKTLAPKCFSSGTKPCISSTVYAYCSKADADLGKTSPTGPDRAEAAAESAVQVIASGAVTTEDTFRAAASNMPSTSDGTILGQAGRWERWAAPAAGQTDRTLISSGQSVYAFQPGSPPGTDTTTAITVHVYEVPDAAPVQMNSVDTEDRLRPAGAETRATNTFRVSDVFFEPRLPDLSSKAAHPAAGLRLWAANEHGFAMAPTYLPPELVCYQQQPQQQQDGASGAADGFKMPFIANIYVKHPSALLGVGHRWGWNIQYCPDPTGPALQHIHHTSLGLVGMQDIESGLKLGAHNPALLTPLSLPSSIDAFMSEHPNLKCSAVEFSYDNNGKLQRQSYDSCKYSSSSSDCWESWYSSGGYTKVPRDLKYILEYGKSVVIEAGAVIPQSGLQAQTQKNKEWVAGVTRWLLSYRHDDGQLESARIEVYTV